jgi:hypothetical protein
MAAPKRNPYSFRERKERPNGQTAYVYRSIRMHPRIWEGMEMVAAREHISMNSLVNALLQLALATDVTDDGQTAIHEACTQWRTRWEHTETAKRQRRLEGE